MMLFNTPLAAKKITLFLISVLIVIICPFSGIKWFTLREIMASDQASFIFWQIRVPRILTAFFAGGGLAVSGMIFQALFRNPLAGPYTLGISGGASLGAAICIYLGVVGTAAGMSLVSLAAFAGAIATALFIYTFAWSNENNSMTLILAGVVISTMCSGLIMFFHQISSLHNAFLMMQWTMGSVEGSNYDSLIIMVLPLIVFYGIAAVLMPQLDHFLTGDDLAHTRGIDVRVTRYLLITVTAFAVGAIVSICGPIGFVGIIAPHLCRMIFPGVRHQFLAISSFFVGGAFLALSDTLGRTLAAPVEIPVGIITALFGGPFFLLVLIKRKNKLLL